MISPAASPSPPPPTHTDPVLDRIHSRRASLPILIDADKDADATDVIMTESTSNVGNLEQVKSGITEIGDGCKAQSQDGPLHSTGSPAQRQGKDSESGSHWPVMVGDSDVDPVELARRNKLLRMLRDYYI